MIKQRRHRGESGGPNQVPNIARRLGVAYHRLNYWMHQGYFGPENAIHVGSGNDRILSDEEVAAMEQILTELKEAQAALHKIQSGRRWREITGGF